MRQLFSNIFIHEVDLVQNQERIHLTLKFDVKQRVSRVQKEIQVSLSGDLSQKPVLSDHKK